MNHVFEECPVFLAHQMLPEHINVAFTRPVNNPYSSTYNLDWRNHPNFSWGPNKNDQIRPKFSNNFQQSPYQQNFSNQSPPPSFQNTHMEIRLSNMERKVDILVKSQDTLAQVLTRIEMQLTTRKTKGNSTLSTIAKL